MARKKSYKEGDWIVHRSYGVGQISCLEKKHLGGKERQYYRVEGFNGTFWVPVEGADETSRVRPVVSKRELKAVIKALEKPAQLMSDNYKQRRADIRQSRLDGSMMEIASLVHNLAFSDREQGLNVREREVLEDLKIRLANEWSVVMGITPQEALAQLNALLSQKGS